MPTDLQARAPLDDRLINVLLELKESRGHTGTVEYLKQQDYPNVTISTLSNMLSRRQHTVSYEFYVGVVGEEPDKIFWDESLDLAKKIAYWHCFYSDVSTPQFAKEVFEEAKNQGIGYTTFHTIAAILFGKSPTKRVDPVITDIVAKKFKDGAGEAQFNSLLGIEELVDYFGRVHNGERNPNNQSWSIAQPVIDTVMRLTGMSFHALMGDVFRAKYEQGGTGGRKVSVKQYSLDVHKRLRELPEYGVTRDLVQVLKNGINILQSSNEGVQPEYLSIDTRNARLTEEELRLVKMGKQTYGIAFIQHIFPMYIEIKHHGFHTEFLEWIANYPNKEVIGRNHRPPRDAISVIPRSKTAQYLGAMLEDYNSFLDSINNYIGHKLVVTGASLVQRLKKVDTNIVNYAAAHR